MTAALSNYETPGCGNILSPDKYYSMQYGEQAFSELGSNVPLKNAIEGTCLIWFLEQVYRTLCITDVRIFTLQ
jgi:hypothetical protein